MRDTTITVSTETKSLLDDRKGEDETWDMLLRRLAGDVDRPPSNEDLMARLDALQDRIHAVESNLEVMGRELGGSP